MTAVRRPAIYAHRGGRLGPPNSADAIRGAIEAGADGVEIDIQLVAGGVLIAEHDPGADPADESLVRLAQLIPIVEGAGIRLLIDFKSFGDVDDEASTLSAFLAEVACPELIAVSSFSVPFLERFQDLAPMIPCYPIVSLRQNFPQPKNLQRWSGASVLAGALMVNPFLLMSLRRNPRRMLVWFGLTEWKFLVRAFRRLGADGVIVDNVSRTATLLDRRP